jgi:hypothetical protein
MSKVINLHPRKYRLVQEIISHFTANNSGKPKAEERSYPAMAEQASGIVIPLTPIIKTGWDYFCSELEFE